MKQITWKKLKKQLLEVQKYILKQNGFPSCKNCGIEPQELIDEIEIIIKYEAKDL